MIQPATNSLGQILTDDFGFAKFSEALKASGKYCDDYELMFPALDLKKWSPWSLNFANNFASASNLNLGLLPMLGNLAKLSTVF